MSPPGDPRGTESLLEKPLFRASARSAGEAPRPTAHPAEPAVGFCILTLFRNIFGFLTPRERFASLWLIGLMVVSMAMEMLGIGIVVPALAAMSSNTLALSSPTAQAWLAYLGNPSPSQLILGGLVALLAIYALKTVILVFSSWQQSAFVARIQARVSEELFQRYLRQPWPFHLARNSADLLRNLGETVAVATCCGSFLSLLAETLVLLGILGLLLWNEPIGAVAVGGVTVGAALLLHLVTRGRVQQWGARYWTAVGQANRIFAEGLQGAKDLKVLGREETLFAQVATLKREQSRLFARNSVFNQLPRLWFELVAVAALCTLTAVMVREGKSPQAMVPTLGLFAAAAFRMLPSANRLVMGLQSLRFNAAAIDVLHADLGLPVPEAVRSSRAPRFQDAIRLERVGFRYDSSRGAALSDVSLTIPCGSAVGLIGGSGAGKSTLVDILLGLLAPTTGRVTVDGIDIAADLRGWQSLVGYVPQSIFLSDDTIRANVAFGVPHEHIDDRAVKRALSAAQLDALIAELPDGWNTILGERGVRLSGGQRQRIGIARALYHDPQLLVLDEATSALDTETEKGVMAAVEALHGTKTLVIVAHRLTTVARCDRLEKGRVVAEGSFAEVTA
jgi:ABC-type multidrug transport system fused ATPase/permease subunit